MLDVHKRFHVCGGALVLLFAVSVAGGEFEMTWQGTRPWAGPEAWTSPMFDWRVEGGRLVARPGPDRLMQNVVWRVERGDRTFAMETEVIFDAATPPGEPAAVWGGFAVGIKGLMDDPRHILVGPKERVAAGVRMNGRVFVGDQVADKALDPSKPIRLKLTWDSGQLTIEGRDGASVATASHDLTQDAIRGNIALSAHASGQPADAAAVTLSFSHWRGSGPGLVSHPDNAFGPILWSQYTRQGNDVKLLAMLAPLGKDDTSPVTLEIKAGEGWKTLDTQAYDPLTCSALLRGTVPDGRVDYRVRFRFQGQDHLWSGTFIPDPAVTGEPLRIGVFSCDHGYAFPLPTMVRNVIAQKPNLLFFAGDQIYENYGGFGIKFEPVDLAMLDYLRKYYQFGWTWREVLKDCPSIILPDDHDVFQGNIWGAGGRKTARNALEEGGYMMPPAWVNGVQRTQTAHLPDAVDPTPVQQDIGVYYTQMTWGGVPIAVIEDRKWKSGPNAVLPKGNRQELPAEALDPAGVQLLGKRQEQFLETWSARTIDEPLRMVFSQTIFCKGHTHTGPKLNQNRYDWDSNGWPRSGRQRALAPFKDGKTVMLHGDQHLGLLVRQGIDGFNDGPYAFMVPGTANGWPRAWWPHGPEGKVAGDFTDVFGNPFTVLAAANPDLGTNQLKTREEGHPEESAHKKGSGHGLVVVDPNTRAVTFHMYRYLFDAGNPQPSDQFPGFPVTITPQ